MITRKYIVEKTTSYREKFKILVKSEKVPAKDLCLNIIDLLSEKKAGEFYIDFCLINDLDPIVDDDEDESQLKSRLMIFVKRDVFDSYQVIKELVDYVDDDILETVIDYYGYDMFITEGKWANRLAAGVLAGTALFGGMNTAHASEMNQDAKEISSTIFTKDIQKAYNIKNVTLDSKAVAKLAEDIKQQIKNDWEKFGYDNSQITKTAGWNRALEIRDTLEEVSPWLCNQFRKTVNYEMHNKLKVTPIL